jgi:hypothetical protein
VYFDSTKNEPISRTRQLSPWVVNGDTRSSF